MTVYTTSYLGLPDSNVKAKRSILAAVFEYLCVIERLLEKDRTENALGRVKRVYEYI